MKAYTSLGSICDNVVYFMINCIFLDGGLYLIRFDEQFRCVFHDKLHCFGWGLILDKDHHPITSCFMINCIFLNGGFFITKVDRRQRDVFHDKLLILVRGLCFTGIIMQERAVYHDKLHFLVWGIIPY